ncbi:MAG: serine/threonine-protein kinase [Actinomycetota bacterium]
MERIADYEVEREMRIGSHGRMFVCHPPARLGIDDERVAVKVLDHHATDEEFRRIANELRLLKSADSPFIVRLLDAGSQAGRLFVVMRYYDQGSLESEFGPHAPALAAQCVADAARGAHALHELGIAHRDIKPGNVLVHDGRGVLADLGLAQMLDSRSTTTGAGPLGALEYMSPSLVRGQKAGRGTDIWSLAATLHRAVVDVGVLGDIDTTSMLNAVRHVMHNQPEIAPDCPDALVPILGRAFQLHDTDPYPTASAFADDLEALIQQGTI